MDKIEAHERFLARILFVDLDLKEGIEWANSSCRSAKVDTNFVRAVAGASYYDEPFRNNMVLKTLFQAWLQVSTNVDNS